MTYKFAAGPSAPALHVKTTNITARVLDRREEGEDDIHEHGDGTTSNNKYQYLLDSDPQGWFNESVLEAVPEAPPG